MSFFVHPQGLCETSMIGRGTRVWAFAHILPGARIGEDCNICDHVFIENDVVVGDRVTIKCGVQLWDGLRVADDVFVGPNAAFTNDKMPRSRHYQESVPQTHVALGASIGANATILPGITIGRLAMVGAGCVVTKDVPPGAIVAGNPGRITGYVNVDEKPVRRLVAAEDAESETAPSRPLSSGVTLQRLKLVDDLRGMLSVGQFQSEVPFRPQRYFLVFDVPSKHVRGEHAHRKCRQFLVCVKGSLSVVADNGLQREEIVLDSPRVGLYVPPMVWCTSYKYSADAILLVFASDEYDALDYIRDYDEFIGALSAAGD
ncbi:MAG: WxcM-like domain-containing protein [Thermoguttaceae bacterium]|jgi:acetyltransferase-like isoleucine patch superfamily enzyme/dTDP-4-dehydrorhamnose 3,5-epimerase-like enzyme